MIPQCHSEDSYTLNKAHSSLVYLLPLSIYHNLLFLAWHMHIIHDYFSWTRPLKKNSVMFQSVKSRKWLRTKTLNERWHFSLELNKATQGYGIYSSCAYRCFYVKEKQIFQLLKSPLVIFTFPLEAHYQKQPNHKNILFYFYKTKPWLLKTVHLQWTRNPHLNNKGSTTKERNKVAIMCTPRSKSPSSQSRTCIQINTGRHSPHSY